MKVKIFFILISSLLPSTSQGQEITNINSITSLFDSTKANFIIIGEDHTSSANPKIVFDLLTFLNRKKNLSTFFMEFSPSEAYLYNKYLETGNKELLQGTIYGGNFNEWVTFWEKIYFYNQKLTAKSRIKIVGFDYERPQTFAFAFKHLNYKNSESFDSLNRYMQSTTFEEKHSNGFPSKDDKEFLAKIRLFLAKRINELNDLDSMELLFLNNTINNQVEGFADNREKEVLINIHELLPKNENSVLMLIGRGHANYKQKNIAHLLKNDTSLNVISGTILYNNCELWVNGFDKLKTVNELKVKPWRAYFDQLSKKIDGHFSFIPLTEQTELKEYFDYLIIAEEQTGLTY